MKKNRRHAMVFLGTLSVAAVLSGVAAAGNPHGTPPGQAKKQSGRASVHATIHQSSHATVHATVHATPHTGVAVTSSSAAGNSVGVKSSEATRFNTHAAAASSSTKLYGNGRTAGQIAMQNGAGASAMLFGPGNSQPHKVALCANAQGHMIDVHALKAHGGVAACTVASISLNGTVGAHGNGNGHAFGHGNGNGLGATVGTKTHVKGAIKATHSKRNRVLAGSGVAGAVTAQARPAKAVVGAANFTG
jgi:hypothetical protein